MAGCVNKVILIGNLGHDPEIRALPNGGQVASLSVATTERWKDKAGTQQERTEWHRISILNDNLVTVAKNYLKKGSRVYIEGSLQTRKWTDKKGESRQTTEIVIGRFRGDVQLLDARQADEKKEWDDEVPF